MKGPDMFCPQCGASMKDDARFCPQCGAPNKRAQAGGAQQQASGQQAQPAGNTAQQPPVGGPFQPGPQQVPPTPQPMPGALYPKGCLAQAFQDMTKIPGVLKRVMQIAFVPALIALVSVFVLIIPFIGGILYPIGLVCAYIAMTSGSGWAIEWGRDLSRGKGFDTNKPLVRTSTFSLGFFSGTLTGILNALAFIPSVCLNVAAISVGVVGGAGILFGYSGGYYSGYGALGGLLGLVALLVVLANILSFVLSIIVSMVSQATVMHLAVTGRVESAFSLGKVWKDCKKELGKLFCATWLPDFLVSLIAGIIVLILIMMGVGIVGSMAYSTYNGYYYGSYGLSTSGIFGFLRGGGVVAIIVVMLVVFVICFASVFGSMLKYRALGHWCARYAEDWTHEGDDDYAFRLPGEAGFGHGNKPGAPVPPMPQQPFAAQQAPQAAPQQPVTAPAPQAGPAAAPAPQAPSGTAPQSQPGAPVNEEPGDATEFTPDFGDDAQK